MSPAKSCPAGALARVEARASASGSGTGASRAGQEDRPTKPGAAATAEGKGYPVVSVFNRLQFVYQRQPPASRHPDATLVNGGTNLFASLDAAIRQGLAELALTSQTDEENKG